MTRCADCVHVPYPHSSACKLLIKPFVIPAIQLLTSIIAKIVYLFHMDDHILDLLYQIIYQMKRIKCNETVDCMYPTSNKYDVEFGALPVATRCWADYDPEVDTSNSFACTASDTCRVSNLDYGETLNSYGFLVEDGNQMVCDACPLQPGGLINQFGCDTYTKQCTCNRSVPVRFSRNQHVQHTIGLHITLALSVFPCVMHVHVENLIKHDLSDNIGPSACVRNVSTHSETPRTHFPAKINFGGKNSRP